MRVNENTRIIGDNVVLVPYRELHVRKYHDWMKSEELQHLTASEPLSLDEEYEMQRSWHVDENKCTFIILDKSIFEETGDEVAAMIGDTNLFFDVTSPGTAEAEIMIAESSARSKKRGWESMVLMMRYGCDQLSVEKYVVKISLDNNKSISMFEKLGFCEVARSDVFSEITMEKVASEDWKQWLHQKTVHSRVDKSYTS